MSTPKDQPQDTAQAGTAHAPTGHDQPGAAPESDTDDEEPADLDSDDDDEDDEEIPEPGETRSPELPDDTLAERD